MTIPDSVQRLTIAERRIVATFLWRESAACKARAEQMQADPTRYSVQDARVSAERARLFDAAAWEMLAAANKG